MSLRMIAVVALALLISLVPQLREPISCMSSQPFASTDSQAPHSNIPPENCGSDAHAAPSWAASCSACGVALLSDGLFLPKEASWSRWSLLEPLAFLSVPSPHWRPPA